MHDFWKIYLSKLNKKKQMFYNLTFYVYLDVYICKKSRKWTV